MSKTQFIMIEPFDDFDGLFCPACGVNFWEGSECHHLMFSFTDNDDDFTYTSDTFESQKLQMEEAIAEKDGRAYKFEKIFHKYDARDCDFVFKVKFPDETGCGEFCTYFGIDFDAVGQIDDDTDESVPISEDVA